jgi:homocysteine S-methyltransferase
MSYDAIRSRMDRDDVIILDGAIGTEILRRNLSWADHRLKDEPDAIHDLHADYIRAGADVITTNSFQLARRSFLGHFRDSVHMDHIGTSGLQERASELLAASVELAQKARSSVETERPVAIAGAVTTLEWCFRPDLAPSETEMRGEYREIMETLAAAGADLILLETVNSIREASVGLSAAREAGLPCWVGFVCDEDGLLFTRETMAEAEETLSPLEPDAILVNCAPPDDTTAGLGELLKARAQPCGLYPHIGRFNPPEWMFTDEYPPPRYLEEAERWAEMGARVIGGCCGTTPEHIEAIARKLGSADA